MSDLCEKCGKEPIYIKKRRLCAKCYGAMYSQLKRSNLSLTTADVDVRADFEGHLQFVAAYFQGRKFLYRAGRFTLPGGRTHTPSFYDVEVDTWIDVIRTRQAYSVAKERYAQLREAYPNLKFTLRNPDGTPYRQASEVDHG